MEMKHIKRVKYILSADRYIKQIPDWQKNYTKIKS